VSLARCSGMEGQTVRKAINIILIVVLLALVLGLLLAIGAETDRPSVKASTGDIDIRLSREEIPGLVEIIKIWKLVDYLELKEEQLARFLPKFKELDDLRKKHYGNRREALAELRKLLEADSSEAQIKSALDHLRDIEAKYSQEEKQLEDTLNSILATKQQAQFVVFQDVYWRDMQRLVRNLRELSRLRERRLEPQPVPLRRKEEQNR